MNSGTQVSSWDVAAIAVSSVGALIAFDMLLVFVWFVIRHEIPANQDESKKFLWTSGITVFNLYWLGGCIAWFILLVCFAYDAGREEGASTQTSRILAALGVCVGEICYVGCTWCRSFSVVADVSPFLEIFMGHFTRIYPFIIMTQIIPAVLWVVFEDSDIETTLGLVYFAVSAVAGIAVIMYDCISLYCFIKFLRKKVVPGEPADARLTTIARYGIVSCGCGLVALAVEVPREVLGIKGAYSNLLGSVVFGVMLGTFAVMLGMKMKLFGNAPTNEAAHEGSESNVVDDEDLVVGVCLLGGRDAVELIGNADECDTILQPKPGEYIHVHKAYLLRNSYFAAHERFTKASEGGSENLSIAVQPPFPTEFRVVLNCIYSNSYDYCYEVFSKSNFVAVLINAGYFQVDFLVEAATHWFARNWKYSIQADAFHWTDLPQEVLSTLLHSFSHLRDAPIRLEIILAWATNCEDVAKWSEMRDFVGAQVDFATISVKEWKRLSEGYPRSVDACVSATVHRFFLEAALHSRILLRCKYCAKSYEERTFVEKIGTCPAGNGAPHTNDTWKEKRIAAQ
ncbi:hypothetical protein HDU98_009304 [Podochytrium sp. JEL0797]|nr:hypothetical protein HDU98_009304 [Podochytrium sp. JEL0797]